MMEEACKLRGCRVKIHYTIVMKMTAPQVKTGLFVGLNKGHVVTRRELAPRPRARKGQTSKRTLFIRSLIREVAGFAPYEKRITELLKVGKDKRALKVAKRKLGTNPKKKKKAKNFNFHSNHSRSFFWAHHLPPKIQSF